MIIHLISSDQLIHLISNMIKWLRIANLRISVDCQLDFSQVYRNCNYLLKCIIYLLQWKTVKKEKDSSWS